MTLRIEAQAEPIPGYRLIERLGGGGFGEVWKAEAPGGLFKAIKFVYGDLEGADEEGARAEQERKSLERIKAVRHPYILSLERYDIIDGRLIIVMELADRTLWDRFKDCRREGLPGIPREELLAYLGETAEALDLMNREHQLQHLDIKPQNLFLNHNHIKVADFGLVKVLEGKVASVTGGVTPVYAAPETFDGLVSRFSDQYSLAIVYQELLNGHRPFNGGTVRQLVVQHLQGTPDLSSLPPQDRAAVSRALSKNPDDRYPACAEFIKALSPPPGKNGKPEAASELGEAHGPDKSNGAPSAETPPPSEGVRATEMGRRSVFTNVGAISHPAWNSRTANGQASLQALSIPAAELGTPPSALSALTSPTTVQQPHRRATPAVTSEDVLLPALVVGLGQLGQEALEQLRREILEHYGPGQPLPQLRFLCLDTDPDAIEAATRGGDFALHQGEVLLTRLHRPSYYVRPKVGTGSLESWLPPKMLYRIPRQQTAAGIRALGRLAFVTHFPAIARRLETELKACLAPDARRQATLHTGMGVASAPRVFVVTGLGGGTGSGMFIDVAYVIKHALRRLGHERPDVVGLFLLPANERHGPQTAAQTNAVAALTELQHFAAETTRFSARYNTGDMEAPSAPFNESGPPFRRVVLLPVDKAADAQAGESANVPAVSRAAHYLFTDLCTPLGRTADRLRQEATRAWNRASAAAEGGSSRAPAGREPKLFYQTVGTYRIVCPRQQVLGRVSRMLCRRLIQRWMTKDARPLREGIKQWVGEKWAELCLGAEQLIEHMHEACEKALRQTAEAAFASLLAPAAALAEGKPDKNGRAAPDPRLFSAVREALEQTGKLVGVPDDGQPMVGRLSEDRDEQTPTLIDTLKNASTALADQCDLKLAQMSVSLIEQPEFRLAGAEETIRQLGAAVDEALQHQEHLAKELHERSVALYLRLRELLDQSGGDASNGSTWKTPIARRGGQTAGPAAELIELLRSYPKCRYQTLILHTVSAFYVGLRGQLSDQLREVDFCRQRLSELTDMMTDERAARPGGPLTRTAMPLNAAVDECLFPDGSKDLEQAVAHLDSTVSAADLPVLDGRIQALVKRQFRALVQVCMGSVNSLGQLAPAMQQEAQAFLAERIGVGDVAEMYLAQHAENEAGFVSPDGLAAAFEQAAPELGQTNPDDELCVLAVPPGAAEQEVRELARRGIGASRLFDTLSDDDIVLYREQLHQGLGDLNAVAASAREAYRRLAAQQALTPHCRVDITQW